MKIYPQWKTEVSSLNVKKSDKLFQIEKAGTQIALKALLSSSWFSFWTIIQSSWLQLLFAHGSNGLSVRVALEQET